MRFARRLEKLYWLSVVFLTVMSSTILVMPFIVSATNENKFLVVVVGVLFWGSAIAGYTSIVMANKERIWFVSKQLDEGRCWHGVSPRNSNLLCKYSSYCC